MLGLWLLFQCSYDAQFAEACKTLTMSQSNTRNPDEKLVYDCRVLQKRQPKGGRWISINQAAEVNKNVTCGDFMMAVSFVLLANPVSISWVHTPFPQSSSPLFLMNTSNNLPLLQVTRDSHQATTLIESTAISPLTHPHLVKTALPLTLWTILFHAPRSADIWNPCLNPQNCLQLFHSRMTPNPSLPTKIYRQPRECLPMQKNSLFSWTILISRMINFLQGPTNLILHPLDHLGQDINKTATQNSKTLCPP